MFKQVTNSSKDWRRVCPNFGIVNFIIRSTGGGGGVFITLYSEV
jgi:hypothetical protein